MTPWSIGYIIGMLERCCGTYKETHPPLPRRGSRDCMLRPQSNAPKSLFSVTLVCIGKSFRIWGGLKQRRSSSQKSKTQSLFHSFLLFTSLLSYDLDAQGCCFYHVHQLMECCIYHAQHHCNPCPWLGEFTTIFTCKDPTNFKLETITKNKVWQSLQRLQRIPPSSQLPQSVCTGTNKKRESSRSTDYTLWKEKKGESVPFFVLLFVVDQFILKVLQQFKRCRW